MKILSPGPILVAGILLTGSGTWATAQTGVQTPDAHHPQTAQAAPQADGPGVGKSEQMPGIWR